MPSTTRRRLGGAHRPVQRRPRTTSSSSSRTRTATGSDRGTSTRHRATAAAWPRLPEYMLQTESPTPTPSSPTTSVHPDQGCHDIGPVPAPSDVFTYQTGSPADGRYRFNVSKPVLFYDKAVFEELGLVPSGRRSPSTTSIAYLRAGGHRLRQATLRAWLLDSEWARSAPLVSWGVAAARAGLPYADNDNLQAHARATTPAPVRLRPRRRRC